MDAQLTEILKQQLRDVQSPEAIGWWPLAFGWWVLLLMLVTSLVVCLTYLLRRRKRNRYRKSALTELQACYANWQTSREDSAYLQTANAIIKRTVLHIDSTSETASQSGQRWSDSLNHFVTQPLSDSTQSALANTLYQPNPTVDVEQIHADLVRWINTHTVRADNQTDPNRHEVQHA